MEEFDPPIHTREDDELIIIANSSADEWQQEAIDQAKAELQKRGITIAEQRKWLDEVNAETEKAWQEELESRRVEDYSPFDKIWIVLFWFKYIFSGWSLKKEGYELKAKRRLQLLGMGLGCTVLFAIWAQHDSEIREKKLIEEIEKVDISEWEKDRLPYDTIELKRKDSISDKQRGGKSN